jgi:predicted transcriptional regulator
VNREERGLDRRFLRETRKAPDEQFDELILDVLEENSNASVFQMADMTAIPPATVFNILKNQLRFVSRKRRFVS